MEKEQKQELGWRFLINFLQNVNNYFYIKSQYKILIDIR